MQNAQPLGTARGVIEIDIRSVEQAALRVVQLSQQMSVAMANMGRGSGQGFAQTVQQIARMQQALIQQTLQSSQTLAQQTLDAVQQSSQQVIQNVQQSANQAVQSLQNVQQQAQKTSKTSVAPKPAATIPASRGGGAFGGGMMPTFIQFSTWSMAGLAQNFGAPGVSQGLMAAGNLAGVADMLTVVGNQAGRLSTNLQGMGGVIGNLATLGANVATALGAGGLAASLSSILFVAAPVAVALGALALIINTITERAKQAEEAAKDYADELERQSNLAGSGRTTAEVQAEINADTTSREFAEGRQSRLTGARDALEMYLERLDELNDRVGSLDAVGITEEDDPRLAGWRAEQEWYEKLAQAQLENASRIAGVQIPSLEALNAAIDGGQTVIDDYTKAIENNTQFIAEGGTAAADAEEAARLLTEREDNLAKARLEALRNAEGMTNADLEKEIQSTLQQYSQINELLASNTGISEDYRAELEAQRDQLEQMAHVYAELQGPLRDFFVELNNLPDRVKDIADFLKKRNELVQQYNAETERIEEDRALSAAREEEDMLRQRQRRIQDFQRQTAQAELDFARDQQRRVEDFDRETARLEQELAQKKTDAQADFAKEELRREQDHQIRMADIIREGRRAQMEAASRLDARAVFETQRRTREQLKDEQRDFELARQRRLEDFEQQLADMEENMEAQRQRRLEDFIRQQQDQLANFQLQQQRRREDFIRQMQQEEADRQLRLQRQQQDYALQDARRREDHQRQINNLIAHNQTMQNIQTAGNNAIQFAWQYLMNGLVASTNATAGQVAKAPRPVTTSGGGGGLFMQSFQTGTSRVPATGTYQLHAGEAVLSPNVASLYRTMLGNDFTQAQAANALAGGGGRGDVTIQWGGNVVLGDIGDRSDEQVIQMFDEAMRRFASQGLARVQSPT